MRRLPTFAALTACLLLSIGCAGDSSELTPAEPGASPQSSFGQIQRQIFDPQCSSCHRPGAVGATETGLLLHNADIAYRSLIGAEPRNAGARQDGLYRVMPRDVDKSLLWHKLQWNADHHGGRAYGNPMPLGGESLSIGQLDFILAWIRMGAPFEGYVADSMLLRDTRKPVIEPFKPLPRPASGFQIRIDSFDVAPNFEREVLVYRRVGNATDVFVNRIETRVRINSHHLLVMAFKEGTPAQIFPQQDVVRDVRAPDSSLIYQNMLVMSWHNFFAGSGTLYEDRRLPAGVALKLPAHAALDLNSHYVNRGSRPIAGEAHVNLHTVPASEVSKVAQTFSVQNDTFALPARARTTITTTHRFEQTTNLLMLTSHNHELAEKFVIRILGGARDGEIIYTSTDWRTPAVVYFTAPIIFQKGEGLKSEVTFNNPSDRTIRHGPTSLDEMNIIRGYWF